MNVAVDVGVDNDVVVVDHDDVDDVDVMVGVFVC